MSARAGVATGSVVGWHSREFSWGMKFGVVLRADQILHSIGSPLTPDSTPDIEDEECEGNFLVLSPRYAGHSWDDNEGTVQVALYSSDPLASDLSGHRIASHGVYRVIDDR